MINNNMLDFSKETLVNLYEALSACGYKFFTVSDYFKESAAGKVCILRHDIDKNLKKALECAYLENKMGITASYYFRYPNTYNESIIKKIHSLGHEIGYHYEVLTKAKGNYETAMTIFKDELEQFKKIAPIKTICAHGAVLSRWDDKSLWEKHDFRIFGITAEVYLSFNFNEILYLTETGRSWNESESNIKDRVKSKLNFSFTATSSLISAVKNAKLPGKIMLNIHPQRWSNNVIDWTFELIAQNIKNIAKAFMRKKKNND